MRKKENYRHGTRSRYNDGCRCSDCKKAQREYMKRLRITKKIEVNYRISVGHLSTAREKAWAETEPDFFL